jgi:hypothetical protein
MEVLTAYVRQHSPRPPEEAQQVGEDAAEEKKPEEDSRGCLSLTTFLVSPQTSNRS